MEVLVADEGQGLYANVNNEYPISPRVPVSEVVKSWSVLAPDPLPLDNIAKYRNLASELVDRGGFDAGPTSRPDGSSTGALVCYASAR